MNLIESLQNALENLVVRFPLEFKTTATHCTCLQFEDHNECRHTIAVNTLERSKRVTTGVANPNVKLRKGKLK